MVYERATVWKCGVHADGTPKLIMYIKKEVQEILGLEPMDIVQFDIEKTGLKATKRKRVRKLLALQRKYAERRKLKKEKEKAMHEFLEHGNEITKAKGRVMESNGAAEGGETQGTSKWLV